MARRIGIGDRLEPMAANLIGLIVERDSGFRQVVEQGFELLVIERQPVLHADIAAACADELVKRVVRAGGTELLPVTRAEPAHCVIIEQYLADRPQYGFVELPGRALVERVEGADGFERVAKEIKPYRLCGSGGVEIDDAASDREFARLAHRVGTDVAVVAKEALQPVKPDAAARTQCQNPAIKKLPRRHALDQRVDRREHDPLVARIRRQPGQGCDAPADDLPVRRYPVIGQAVPSREGQRLDLGVKERERRGKPRHPAVVAADMQPPPG